MKKLFSLLFVALLAMSAWGKVVTIDFAGMYESNTNLSTIDTGQGITLTFSKASGSNVPAYNANAEEVRMYKNTTLNVAADEGYTITKIDFTFTQSKWQQNPSSANVGTIGSDGNWTGSANSVLFTNNYEQNTQIRFNKMEITVSEPTVEGLVAPVFNPNGGEFIGSIAVNVSCATENAAIYVYKIVDGEWTNQQYFLESGTFYVNETSSYVAYSTKGSEYSDYVYVDFTKVTPQVATPTFTPASGAEFADELDVTINCATPGATIMYEYGDVIDEALAPVTITLTDNATITAVASLEGYADSEQAIATYTKMSDVPAGGTYTLVTDVTTLQAGDKIALVGMKDNVAYVMSTKRNNNFGGVEIVLDGNKFTTDKAANITLEQNEDIWNLKVSAFDENGVHVQGYLFAAGANSNNYMRVEDAVDSYGNADALITNGDDNEAVIVFQNDKSRNIVRFNDNLSETTPTLFSCYEEGKQKPVYIYKLMSEVVLPAAPTISPESQEFSEPIEVTITNNEPGATLMYALNDGEFAEYEAPFTVSETTTVKAYAEKDGVTSEPVTATYTYVAPTVTVANLAEVHALDSATNFIYTGNIVVTFRNTSNIFVRDNANNSALIYQSGLDAGIDKGTTIAPNWGGTKTIYFNETEIINLENFTANGTQEVLPFERQSISSADYAAYVVIKNVAIDSTYVWGNRNTYVTNTGVIVRDNWQKGFSPETGKTYDIIGIVSAYQGTTVLNIVEVVGYVPEVNEVSTIAETAELGVGEEFTYVSEAVVVYQPAGDLRYTWIKDGSGYGLIYDNKRTVPAMEQGTVLKDGWSAQVDIYNGAKQFVSPQNVEASDDDPVEVNPIEMTNVAIADVHKYVIMKGQTLTATGANKTWDNADGLIFYDKFNVNPTFEEGKTYDVVGIVTTYTVSGEIVPEIFIISATEAAAQQWALGDVNHDTFVNVADVTALIQYILTSGEAPAVFYVEQANIDGDVDGTLNVADVTALIQLVLNQ